MRLSIVVILLLCVHFNNLFVQSQSSSSHLNEKEAWKVLHEAIQIGNENAFRRLLMSDVNINATDENGNTALMRAAEIGSESITKLLIENGANINAVNADNKTAFSIAMHGHENVAVILLQNGANFGFVEHLRAIIWAARDGFEKVTQILIEKGADVNAMNANKNSALIFATDRGYLNIVRMLVENGADVNHVNIVNHTALRDAIDVGFEKIAELLLRNGGDGNIVGQNGQTMLSRAAERGWEKIVDLLIQKGAHINAETTNGQTRLSVYTALHLASVKGFENIVQLLIARGANVNPVSEGRSSALTLAAENGHDKVARLLIQNGANVNVVGPNGETALMEAAKNGHETTIRILIDNGADVNIINNDHDTALLVALRKGYDKIAALLIQNSADVNVVGNDNSTALTLATEREFVNIVQMLIQKYSRNINSDAALNIAALNGYENIARMLIDNGANVNFRDKYYNTALLSALSKGYDKIAELLIQKGADVHAVGQYGDTALIWAAQNGFDEIIEILIKKGANVNAMNEDNSRALLYAVKDGFGNIARLLVENGADLNFKNKNNESPLLSAISRGFDKTAALLIQKGADINIVGESGQTALMTAIDRASSYRKIDASRSAAIENIGHTLVQNGANINATNADGDTALMLAVMRGDIRMIMLLIDHGANINTVNNENQSALIKAILGGDEEILWNFLLYGKDVNVDVGSQQKDSALIIAIKKRIQSVYGGDAPVPDRLISMGADVNAVGNNGFTPLQIAAMVGNDNIVRILIKKGVNVNATNDDGDSALILAAKNNHARISRMLIGNGANLNHKGAHEKTPLTLVSGQGNLDILQLFIDKGANINAIDEDHRTALDAAFEAKESEDRKEVVRLLTKHGAETGATLLYRKTALNACQLYTNLTSGWNGGIAGRIFGGTLAEIGEFPWMVALGYLNSEYKINFRCGGSLISDEFVLTAAHCVRDNGRPVVARLGKVTLSDEGDFQTENQNIREIILHPQYSHITKKNDIALIRLVERVYITRYIQPICIQTLLRDEDIQKNLTVAGWGQTNTRKTSTKLLKALLKTMPQSQCDAYYADYNKERNLPAFRLGIDRSQYCAHDPFGKRDSCQGDSGGPLQTTQKFLEPAKVVGVVSFGVGCGIGIPGIYTRAAHYIDWIGAYVWPNGEIVTPRVSHTADDSVDVNNAINDTALNQAISRKYDSTARLLIEDGTDINLVGNDGFTPLIKAADVGNEEIAQILIEKGANVNAVNDMGDSALNLAVLNNRENITKWLIEHGADINHEDANDETPLITIVNQASSYCLNDDCPESKAILQLLIDKGANINAVNSFGNTALDVAFQANQDSKEVIRILTEHGAQRGATLLLKKTALDACVLYTKLTARWNYLTARGGGSMVRTGEFPWMVALGYVATQNKLSFSCGGSLISDEFVLTAAHCVEDNRRPVLARFGEVTLADGDFFRGEKQNIREIILHPEYSSNSEKNDIALIQLTERIDFTKSVHPICLQTLLRDEHPHTNLIVTRWGAVNVRETSKELLKVHLKTMPLAQCNATFLNYYKDRNLPKVFRYEIDESQYCAYDSTGNRDSCQANSGASLQTTQTDSNPVKLVGIASFDVGCSNGLPGIYTRVAHHIDWIGTHVWLNGEIQTPHVYIANDNNDNIIFPSDD